MKNKNVTLIASLFFLVILLLVIFTFNKSYYRIATASHHYSVWILVHAFSLSVWVILLFIQPLFIYSGNPKWHKQAGFFSIGIVVLLLVSTVFIAAHNFAIFQGSAPPGKKYSVLLTQLYGLAVFAFLYTRALLNARSFSLHVQYMVSSTIIILGPVIFRATNRFQLSFFGNVELTCNVLTYAVLNVLLIAACCLQAARKEVFFPYLFTLVALLPMEISQVWFSQSV